MELLAYRLLHEGFSGSDSSWIVALDMAEVLADIDQQNASEKVATHRTWTAETMTLALYEGTARRLGAKLVGSITSPRKSASSRANGQLGGRPKGSKNRPKT